MNMNTMIKKMNQSRSIIYRRFLAHIFRVRIFQIKHQKFLIAQCYDVN